MKTFKIWVEREDITQELFEVEAETLEEAIEMAESCEGEFHDQLHIDGNVLDSWEDGSR